MATPALRALNRHFPEATIDVLTGPWSAPALAGNPNVARVLDYPSRPTPRSLMALVRELRRRRYDVGIGLDRSPVVNGLLWLARISERAGIDNQGRGIGLTRRAVPRPGQHETELFLTVTAGAGAPAVGVEPEYHVDPSLHERVGTLLPPGDGPLVIVHPGGAVNPGATMPSKRWPSASFAALVNLVVGELGARVVLVGAESDRAAVDRVRDGAGVPVTDLCGRLDLPSLAAVVRRADVYIGNDSGASHLAAAVGTPTITIFGPTSPRRYRPLGARSLVCAPPTSWDLTGDVDLRGGQPGLTGIDIAQVTPRVVLQAVNEALADSGVGSHR